MSRPLNCDTVAAFTPYTIKNRTKMRFFLHIRKFCCIFALEMIHAGECGRVCQPSILTRIVQRHNKRRLLALVLVNRKLETFFSPKSRER